MDNQISLNLFAFHVFYGYLRLFVYIISFSYIFSLNFKNLVHPIVINEQNHSNFKPKRVSLELITRKKDWYSLYPVNTLNKTILFTNNQFLIVWKSRKSFELHGHIMFVFIFDLTLNQTKGKKTKYCLN